MFEFASKNVFDLLLQWSIIEGSGLIGVCYFFFKYFNSLALSTEIGYLPFG